MKKRGLFIIFIVSLAVFACDNPLMKNILKPITITFDSNGGSYVPPQTVLKNEKISEPQNPVKDGYIFNGWFKENDSLFESKWNFNDIPEEDMTLYAAWDGTQPF